MLVLTQAAVILCSLTLALCQGSFSGRVPLSSVFHSNFPDGQDQQDPVRSSSGFSSGVIGQSSGGASTRTFGDDQSDTFGQGSSGSATSSGSLGRTVTGISGFDPLSQSGSDQSGISGSGSQFGSGSQGGLFRPAGSSSSGDFGTGNFELGQVQGSGLGSQGQGFGSGSSGQGFGSGSQGQGFGSGSQGQGSGSGSQGQGFGSGSQGQGFGSGSQGQDFGSGSQGQDFGSGSQGQGFGSGSQGGSGRPSQTEGFGSGQFGGSSGFPGEPGKHHYPPYPGPGKLPPPHYPPPHHYPGHGPPHGHKPEFSGFEPYPKEPGKFYPHHVPPPRHYGGTGIGGYRKHHSRATHSGITILPIDEYDFHHHHHYHHHPDHLEHPTKYLHSGNLQKFHGTYFGTEHPSFLPFSDIEPPHVQGVAHGSGHIIVHKHHSIPHEHYSKHHHPHYHGIPLQPPIFGQPTVGSYPFFAPTEPHTITKGTASDKKPIPQDSDIPKPITTQEAFGSGAQAIPDLSASFPDIRTIGTVPESTQVQSNPRESNSEGASTLQEQTPGFGTQEQTSTSSDQGPVLIGPGASEQTAPATENLEQGSSGIGSTSDQTVFGTDGETPGSSNQASSFAESGSTLQQNSGFGQGQVNISPTFDSKPSLTSDGTPSGQSIGSGILVGPHVNVQQGYEQAGVFEINEGAQKGINGEQSLHHNYYGHQEHWNKHGYHFYTKQILHENGLKHPTIIQYPLLKTSTEISDGVQSPQQQSGGAGVTENTKPVSEPVEDAPRNNPAEISPGTPAGQNLQIGQAS